MSLHSWSWYQYQSLLQGGTLELRQSDGGLEVRASQVKSIRLVECYTFNRAGNYISSDLTPHSTHITSVLTNLYTLFLSPHTSNLIPHTSILTLRTSKSPFLTPHFITEMAKCSGGGLPGLLAGLALALLVSAGLVLLRRVKRYYRPVPINTDLTPGPTMQD